MNIDMIRLMRAALKSPQDTKMDIEMVKEAYPHWQKAYHKHLHVMITKKGEVEDRLRSRIR